MVYRDIFDYRQIKNKIIYIYIYIYNPDSIKNKVNTSIYLYDFEYTFYSRELKQNKINKRLITHLNF